jgi:uncharacterized RDD family membrane protein YckC
MAKPVDTTVFGPLVDEAEDRPVAPVSAAIAGPWTRYWSRTLDLALGQYAVGGAIGLAFAFTNPAMLQSALFSTGYGGLLLAILTFPVVMAIDAVVLATFGNTLGRWIAGVRVETVDGGRPSLALCLHRNALVYVFGLALSVPLATLFSLINSFTEVNESGLAHWDRTLGTRVHVRGGNLWRTTLTAAIYLGIHIPTLIAWLASVDRS